MKKINSVLLIVPILIIATSVSYIPHINYQYPLHVDEWFHITVAQEVISGSGIDLYSGQPFALGMERLWHLMLAGIFLFAQPLQAYVFLVMGFSILAVLSVYVFAKRFGERTALISAFLTALIPSNVTIGGLSFLVPINLSLIFIPLALKFAFDAKTKLHYFMVFLLTAILLYAHPPSAMVLLILLGIYGALKIKEDKIKARNLFVAIFSAVIVSIPNYAARVAEKGIESASFPFWLFVEQTPILFGIIPTVFFIAGFYLLTRTKEKENWTLILALIFLLAEIFLYTQISASYLVPYQRIFIPMMFLMNIIAACAMARINNNILLGIILAAILILSVQQHFAAQYYHVIDENEFNDILWIKENTSGGIILADPWKARPIPAITGMRVFTVLPFGPVPELLKINQQAIYFFKGNCTNTSFLKDNNISLIYSPVECNNTDLEKLYKNIYKIS